MTKAIKEIIIMLLVCFITMLVLAVALYKFLPNKKSVPEIVEYEVSEQVQDLLEDNIDQRSDEERVLLTYEVTSSDLSGYQVTNDYVPGKSNPFAEASKSINSDEIDTTNYGTGENGSSSNEKENQGTVTPSNPSVYEGSGK